MELRQGRAAIKELIVHTVVSGGTDGKRKEFGKFRCILSSQGGRWEAWCVRGHVAERVERGAHFNWTWRLARKKRGRCVSEVLLARSWHFRSFRSFGLRGHFVRVSGRAFGPKLLSNGEHDKMKSQNCL